MEQKTILQQIKSAVLSVDPSSELVLFGSRARGDYNNESDWDILILSDNIVDYQLKSKISDNLFNIGLNNTATISTIVINKQNWYNKFKGYPLFFEVKRDGIKL